MLLTPNYVTERYHSQVSIREAGDAQNKTPQGNLWDLGAVICKHDMEKVVGVTLLHKHFDLVKDEQLVRRYSNRQGSIKPGDPSPHNTPCIWSLNVSRTSFMPLEFSDSSCNPEAISDLQTLATHSTFLNQFAHTLTQKGMASLYGLATLHGAKHLNPATDETVIERPVSERELKLDVIPVKSLREVDTIQTLWIFTKKSVQSATACPMYDPENTIARHCYHCPGHHCPFGPLGCG